MALAKFLCQAMTLLFFQEEKSINKKLKNIIYFMNIGNNSLFRR